jgi:RHS repeat-associated protein
MKSFKWLFALCMVTGFAFGQTDGLPPFVPADRHEVDTINLLTLQPVLNINAPSKAEIIPFGFAIEAPQYCLIAGTGLASGVGCHGNLFSIEASGMLTVGGPSPLLVGLTPCGNTQVYYYANWVITDGLGTHLLPPGDVVYGNSACGPTSFTDTTIDGSGYTVSLTITDPILNPQFTATVTSASGHWVSFTENGTYNPLIETDTFGNTQENNNNVFSDSLGTTAITYNSTNNTIQWTDSTGTSRDINVSTGTTLTISITGDCAHNHQNGSFTPITSINYPDGTSISNIQYEEGAGGSGTTTTRVSSFTTREGGAISYVYPTPCASGSVYGDPTLSRTTSDGTTTYTQTLVQNGDYIDSYTTVLDPGMNKVVYYFTSGWSNTSAQAPVLTEKQVYQNTGTISSPSYTLLSTDVYCYNTNQTSCQTANVFYPITERDAYHTIGSMASSMRVSETFDSYGNRTSISYYNFGVSSFTTQTNYTYAGCGQGSTIKNSVCSAVTTDGTHTLSQSTYTYNSAGFMLTSSVWNGSTWITATYSPNTNGTVASATDPNGTITTYGYAPSGSGGCNGLLATSISVAPASGDTLTASKTWNCNSADITGTVDPNGNTTSTTYDPMFRVATFTDQSGLETIKSYTGNSTKTSYSFGSVSFSGTTTTDGYGRPILLQIADGSQYDTVSAGYFVNGYQYPLNRGSTPTLEPLGEGPSLNSSNYFDALGRTTTIQDAVNGTASFSYTGGTNSAGAYAFDSQITIGPAPSGEHVKISQSEYDGLGRLISTCGILTSGGSSCGQVDGGSGVLTTFAYSFGMGMTTVTATRGLQTHTSISDALGRPTSVTTPESGTVTNTYDSDSGDNCGSSVRNVPGDLAKTTRNDGTYICFIYNDGLHRLTDVMNSTDNSANPCKRYRYDNSTGVLGAIPSGISSGNPLGRLVEAETDTCASPITSSSMITDEWFGYDKNGRLTDVWEYTPISKIYYHTNVFYYLNGVPNALSGLPGFSSLTYGLDGNGRSITANLGSEVVVSGVTFNAAGQPINVGIGSGTDNDQYSYDVVGNMSQYQFFVGSTSNKGALTWNADGTLQSLGITDGFNSNDNQTCNYLYDDISRLTTDNCGSVWSQTYSYDQYDNLTKSGSASWVPGYNSANNQYENGATYDSNGNLTSDGAGNNYTWDSYGKMATATGVTVTYDAFGRPVANGSAEILYTPFGKVGVLKTSALFDNAYVPLPGGGAMSLGCCISSAQAAFYLHRDWLGSSRVASSVATSGSGSGEDYSRSFSPYGDVYQNSGYNDPLLFAGMNSDLFGTSGTSSGLYDTPNRELANNASRWLSPDPAGASWNAYAYVTDPNRIVDFSGLDGEEAADECGGGGGWDGGCEGGSPPQPQIVYAPCPNAPGCPPSVQPLTTMPEIIGTQIVSSTVAFGETAGQWNDATLAILSGPPAQSEPTFAGGFWGANGVRGSDSAFGLVMGTFNAPQAALAHHTCGDGIVCNIAVSAATGVALGGAVSAITRAGIAVPSIIEAAESSVSSGSRFIVNSSGQVLDTSAIKIPGPVNSIWGKVDFLLGNVTEGTEENVAKSADRGLTFRAQMGFDESTLGAALQNHLIENFENVVFNAKGNINAIGSMTGPSGVTRTILSAWQALPDGTISFVTAFPQ